MRTELRMSNTGQFPARLKGGRDYAAIVRGKEEFVRILTMPVAVAIAKHQGLQANPRVVY